MQARREKGLCYNCDERFGPGHRCKRQQIFLLETMDDTAEHLETMELVQGEEEQSTLEISLHALSGVNTPQMMRVTGMIHGRKLHILIDSGSTHNFVSLRFAKRMNCCKAPAPVFQVMVANGERLRCDEIYLAVPLEIQGYKFKTNMYPLDLQGSDVVLGIQWLQSLGQVLHDWQRLTMEFWCKDERFVLQREGTGTVEHQSLQSIARLASNNVKFGVMQLSGGSIEVNLTEPSRDQAIALDALLQKYQLVFQAPTTLPPPRRHDHGIPLEPGSGPVSVRPYRYPHIQKNEIEKAVKEMLSTGIIQPSTSPFSSPILLVKKKDGSWRFCVDYRALNRVTVKDRYPIPAIDELLDELHGAAYFTKLDLKSGYHQIRVQPEDVHKTAFRSHDGHYEFMVMPFGLTNAPATFQSLMNDIFRPLLRRYVLVFFDDILIYSKTWNEHLFHLEIVLGTLLKHQLYVNHSKCLIGRKEVEYLGHVISAAGVAADPQKIRSMESWPVPTNTTALRGFLGLTGYYRKFIRGYGTIAAPLTQLLKKDGFCWSDAAEKAFHTLKQAMVQAPVLMLPDFSKQFVVETDASGTGLGAVLMQEGRPVAYYSKAISGKALGRSTYEKELMAIVLSVNQWRNYLVGRRFRIRTDHRSLKYLLEQRISTMDQQKWIVKLMGYDYDIEYRPGRENMAADALSRLHGELVSITYPQPIWLADIQREAQTDSKLTAMREALSKNPSRNHGYEVRGEQLWFKGRLVLPQNSRFKNALLHEFHDTPIGGHLGIFRTYKRVAASFYWVGMKKDIQDYVQRCDVCQRNKHDSLAPAGLLQL